MTKSTMVTNDAIITINDGILTFAGITFLKADTTRFDATRTKVVASPMAIPFMAAVVTARVVQNFQKKKWMRSVMNLKKQ